MQVYECSEQELDMTRDMDLIRKLLLWIEQNPQLDGKRWFVIDKPEEVGVTDHSLEDIEYHMRLLTKAGLVEGRVNVTTGITAVSQLTWTGHEFLDNVKDSGVWESTKARVAGLPGVALAVIAEIAKAEIKKRLGLP
jgi:hypothetical protein